MTTGTGQSAAERELIARRLRLAHERVARATERCAPTAFADLASHYDQSGNNQRALDYALLAADIARLGFRHAEAMELLEIAERNTLTAGQLAEVRVRRAQVEELLGRYADALRECELALEHYTDQGDTRRTLSLRRTRERLRSLLGEPFRHTLGSCIALAEETRALGVVEEHIQVLLFMSQLHEKLGESDAAEQLASTAVQAAEPLADQELLADALLRFGITVEDDRPQRALELFEQALNLYRKLGVRRGEARCHNNAAVLYMRLDRWAEAEGALARTAELAALMGLVDLEGIASVNLGVARLKQGRFDEAFESFARAFAAFTEMGNEEYTLIALYNLANVDRERAEHGEAVDGYDLVEMMARRLQQNDVETGAPAGAGLSLLAQGKVDEARGALDRALDRLGNRTDWFPGREMIEALRIRVMLLDGRQDAAAEAFRQAVPAAEQFDFYAAAWLVAECAEPVHRGDARGLATTVGQYADRVRAGGYGYVSTRYEAILNPR